MYRVSIRRNDLDDSYHTWWENFVTWVTNHGGTTAPDARGTRDSRYEKFVEFLTKYNGHDIKGTRFLDFDTEEDFVVFKLKFG